MLELDRLRVDPVYRWVWIGYLTLVLLAAALVVLVAWWLGWL